MTFSTTIPTTATPSQRREIALIAETETVKHIETTPSGRLIVASVHEGFRGLCSQVNTRRIGKRGKVTQ